MLLADLDLRRSKVFIHIGRPAWKVISEPPPHAFLQACKRYSRKILQNAMHGDPFVTISRPAAMKRQRSTIANLCEQLDDPLQ